MRNKKIVSIVAGVLMVGIAGILLFQIGSNHQESMLIIEKCFENFEKEGVVVIEKKNFWSPASCVKQ